ncbi:transketolase family protein [bacterium]|nr:transketolase family protein [bacterium]MBU0899652.1 transketolase family protein [bacterium]MBU1152735.1 transketolase family protein [bacterium]MBU1782500.1 transketolase family protein [bacterium]
MDKEVATRDVYGKTLQKIGSQYPNIIVLDADCSSSTRTSWFARDYPERFFNLGIAEANMMGMAAGLATCGKIVFASTFAIFGSARCFEQVRDSICWTNLNVKIVVTHAGLSVGEDGASHQAIEDVTLMRSLPNMTVIVPVDGIETERAIIKAVETSGPFYIRLGRAKFPIVLKEDYQFQIGKAVTLREGNDVTIIAVGLMISESLKAALILEKEGISTRVINMSTIKPIDKEVIIKAAQETKAIITAEEHTVIGGLGGAVAEVLGESVSVPMRRIGIPDVFGFSATPNELLEYFKLTGLHIAQTVREVLS